MEASIPQGIRRCILRPYSHQESMSVALAAETVGRSAETIRRWISHHGIGRKIGGTNRVSRVALAMLVEGDPDALAAYHSGDRTTDLVVRYFKRAGVPLPCDQADV